MDISRVSAIVLAVLAAVLVIVAGKSCTDDIESANRRTRLKNKASTIATVAIETAPPATQAATTVPATEPPTLPYDIVTNMLGDIVETIPKPTNEFGEIETTECTETKSILEQYEDLHTTTEPVIELETVQTEETTKYIEPAKDIVIEIG